MPAKTMSKVEEYLEDMKSQGFPSWLSIGLTKFLKSKRYCTVQEEFELLSKTLKWIADFWPGKKVDEDFRREMDGLWFASGRDREGRPLCYSVLEKKSWKKLLSTCDNKWKNYLRWRILGVKNEIQNLSRDTPAGVGSVIHVIDLKNCTGSPAKEIWEKIVTLIDENYPGLVHKTLIMNAPSWFVAVNALHLQIITKRSNNRLIFVKPSKVTETLLKYASAENIQVQHGGLKREDDVEFSTDDKAHEVEIKANTTEHIQIPVNEVETTITWDVTVVGCEVAYKEEFIPDDDCSYRVLIQERKKMGESIRNSFHIRERGKIVLSIGNGPFTRKRVFYRFKSRPSVPRYRSLSRRFSMNPTQPNPSSMHRSLSRSFSMNPTQQNHSSVYRSLVCSFCMNPSQQSPYFRG